MITYKDWMKRTALYVKPRSDLLKEVDRELLSYETSPGGGAAMWHLEQKLKKWQNSKGPGDAWRKSERNKKFAIDQLHQDVTGVSPEASMPTFLQKDMDNARLGVLYLFGQMQVSSNIFNVVLSGGLSVAGSALSYAGSPAGGGNAAASAAATNLKTVMIPGSALLEASEGAARSASASPEIATLGARFRAWLDDFAKKVVATLKEKFGDIDLTLSAIKNLLNILASVFLKNAAPFISAGMDIFKGLVNTADATIAKLRTWMAGRGVELLPGHPSVVVDAIKRGMTMSLLEGLYQTLKGAGSVGLEFLTGAASLVINIVVAITETIIKVVWRLAEIAKMQKFFKEARYHWQTHGVKNAFHTNFIEFNSWYRQNVITIPALAILTLNSGICGDKMRFLRMVKSDDTIVSQSEFDTGVTYLDGLKNDGAKLLNGCGYNFSSDDKVVDGLISFAGKHGTYSKNAWDHVVKFANA